MGLDGRSAAACQTSGWMPNLLTRMLDRSETGAKGIETVRCGHGGRHCRGKPLEGPRKRGPDIDDLVVVRVERRVAALPGLMAVDLGHRRVMRILMIVFMCAGMTMIPAAVMVMRRRRIQQVRVDTGEGAGLVRVRRRVVDMGYSDHRQQDRKQHAAGDGKKTTHPGRS